MKTLIESIKNNPIKTTLILLSIVSISLVIFCLYFIPINLNIFIKIFVVLISLFILYGLFILHKKHPKTSCIIESIVVVVLIVSSIGVFKVHSFMNALIATPEFETIRIVASADSRITPQSDLSQLSLAYATDDPYSHDQGVEVLEYNEKDVAGMVSYADINKAYQALLIGEVDLLVLTTTSVNDLVELYDDYENNIRLILYKDYELVSVKPREVDISKKPFTLYIQGADLSAGQNINSTGRGDVNILLTINPVTNKVNLQVIPRDLFVYIPSKDASSKLSYSGGWGGIESSITSIEKALDVEINYYAKLNFTGLTQLVDALGGVEVYSHYTYDAGGYSFVKGMNTVNGEKALMFSRARKMLPLNDRSRGLQQMELIKGIFTKFAEVPTFNNALSIIDALENNFTTNLPQDDFYKAFQLVVQLLPQLQTMENHTIEGEYVWHYDEVRPTYYQYYFYPYDGEVELVKQRIEDTLKID